MGDGIERVILTNEELLQATAAILNEQLSPNISPSVSSETETDNHSIQFCSDFFSPLHEPHLQANRFQFEFNSLQHTAGSDQPIDPRLKPDISTINPSILHHTLLEPIPSDLQSILASEAAPKPGRSAKRRKTNLKTNQNIYLHALDIPTCHPGLADISTPQSLPVNEISVPTDDSHQSQGRINVKYGSFIHSRGQDVLKHDDSSYQPNLQRPSSSISAILHTGHPPIEVSEAFQAESSVVLYENPSSSSLAEPHIHPLLQAIGPSLPAHLLVPPCLQPIDQADSHYIQIVRKNVEPERQVPEPLQPPTHVTSYPGNSQVDVHGAGAGGGAATVLAAAAAQQVSSMTTVPVPQQDTSVATQVEEAQEDGLGEASAEPLPTSFNPDQFRSCNRIHWTKEEEDLLQAEVELNWERYDCMAQIMKRHGPRGSVSKAFADRTAVSLKDKAVNISSRWYRDGTEVSASRRRAFARFRPKQLRGKPRNELPGMVSLADSFPSGPNRYDPQHPPSSAGSQ